MDKKGTTLLCGIIEKEKKNDKGHFLTFLYSYFLTDFHFPKNNLIVDCINAVYTKVYNPRPLLKIVV